MADELDRDELQMPGLKHIHCDVSEFELFIADLLGVAPVDRNGNVRSFGSYSNDNEPGILWMVYNIPDHISIYSDHPCHRINIYHRYGGKDSLVLIVPCDFPNTHPKPSITIYDSDGGAWPVDSIHPEELDAINRMIVFPPPKIWIEDSLGNTQAELAPGEHTVRTRDWFYVSLSRWSTKWC